MGKKLFSFLAVFSSYDLTFLRSYVPTFFLCLLLMGCEKKVSDQLKGKWQLRTIEEAGQLTPVDTGVV